MPPVTATMIVSVAATTDNLSEYTTASGTPGNGNLWITPVILRDNTGQPAAPTVAGMGGTWTLVGTKNDWMTSSDFGTLFVYQATDVSSSGTLTITAAELMTAAAWGVIELANTSGVINSKNGSASAATSLDVTMDTTPANGSAMVGCWAQTINQLTTPEGGYTKLGDAGAAAPTNRLGVSFLASGDATVSMTCTSAAELGGIALEIVARPDNLPLLGVS